MNFLNIEFDEPKPEFWSAFRKRSIFYLQTIKSNESFTIRIRKEFRQLFDVFLPQFSQIASHSWNESPRDENLEFLRLYSSLPEDLDCNRLYDWASFVNGFIWRDLNKLPKNWFHGDELDYCLAIDWNFYPDNKNVRTVLGEAEYFLKYRATEISKEWHDHYFQLLRNYLHSAYYFLHQYFTFLGEEIFVSPVPLTEQSKSKPAYRLAEQITIIYSCRLINPILLQPKPQMKDLPVEGKIRTWQNIYNAPNSFQLNEDITGKTICIIDDTYQSGASMWSYAKFLKERGAKYVFGISCVKTLRDTDNV